MRWTRNVRPTLIGKGAAESTTLRAISHGSVIKSVELNGLWGIPAVTSVGLAGGLSPDGAVLVLSQPPSYSGLRSRSLRSRCPVRQRQKVAEIR